MDFTIDIEPTNRCNAKCHFCPRDQTPHQGLMVPEVFDRALARAVEYREAVRPLGHEIVVALCGLGEPLLNKHTPSYVRAVRDAGFHCAMSSNGALLDERRSEALFEAGLQEIYINVGEEGADYEDVYKLPWQQTRDNVVRFHETAPDDLKVYVVLVDHRMDKAHIRRMRQYWKDLGITDFQSYDIMNRGGALFVDHMEYEAYPELERARALLEEAGARPVCGAPFGYMFVGYDGQYYLCCSDWKKEVPLGSVFEASLLDVTGPKLVHSESREPICKTCNLDPLNQLIEELRAGEGGSPEKVISKIGVDGETVMKLVAELESVGATGPATVAQPNAPRRSIPVTAL